MKKKKELKIGIVLLVIAVLIAGYFFWEHISREKPNSHIVKIEKEAAKNRKIPRPNGKPDKEDSEKMEFEVRNITDESLKLMDKDLKTLSEMIYKWTQKNGEYRGTIGVEFYPDVEIDMSENKYRFLMKTIVDVENGAREESSRILVLDYYKDKKSSVLHP